MVDAATGPLAIDISGSPTSTAGSNLTDSKERPDSRPYQSASPTSTSTVRSLQSNIFPTQLPTHDFAIAAIRSDEAMMTLIRGLELHDDAQRAGIPVHRLHSWSNSARQVFHVVRRDSGGAAQPYIRGMSEQQRPTDIISVPLEQSLDEETEKEDDGGEAEVDRDAGAGANKKKKRVKQKKRKGNKTSSEDGDTGTSQPDNGLSTDAKPATGPAPDAVLLSRPVMADEKEQSTAAPVFDPGQHRGISVIRLPQAQSAPLTPTKSARAKKEEKRAKRKLERQELYSAAVSAVVIPTESFSPYEEAAIPSGDNDSLVMNGQVGDAAESSAVPSSQEHEAKDPLVGDQRHRLSDDQFSSNVIQSASAIYQSTTDDENTPVPSRTSTAAPDEAHTPMAERQIAVPTSVPMVEHVTSADDNVPNLTFGSLTSDHQLAEPLTPPDTTRTFDEAAKQHMQHESWLPAHAKDFPSVLVPEILVEPPSVQPSSDIDSLTTISTTDGSLPQPSLEGPLYSGLPDEPTLMLPVDARPVSTSPDLVTLHSQSMFSQPLALNHTWVLFFSDNSDKAKKLPVPAATRPGKRTSAEEYSFHLRPIFEASNLHDLLGSWKALRRKIADEWDRKIEVPDMRMNPAEGGLGIHCLRDEMNFHFFVKGVQPMWEDPLCTRGGKVMFSGNGPMMDVLFFELVLLFVSGEVDSACPSPPLRHNILCGAVLCRKKGTTRIEVWLGGRDAPDKQWVARINGLLHHQFPQHKIFEYRPFHGGH